MDESKDKNLNPEKEKEETKKTNSTKFKNGVTSFFTDFKKFILKGNIIDLAVAVVIGAAFNKIVTSLVNNIIMPLVSLLVGGASVADWKWVISPATYDELGNIITAETAMSYGIFIQSIIDFLIVGFTIFVMLKIIVNAERGVIGFGGKIKNKMKKKGKETEVVEEVAEQPVPVKIESQEDILKDIRALLQLQDQANKNNIINEFTPDINKKS